MRSADRSSNEAGSPPGGGSKFLIFSLGREEYGIDILRVQEVAGVPPITPLPRASKEVLGLMNLRGNLLPVIDLRQKLGLPAPPATSESCIIVALCGTDRVGLLVDRVNEVVDTEPVSIDAAEVLSWGVAEGVVHGIVHKDERIKILLDIDRLLPSSRLDQNADSDRDVRPDSPVRG